MAEARESRDAKERPAEEPAEQAAERELADHADEGKRRARQESERDREDRYSQRERSIPEGGFDEDLEDVDLTETVGGRGEFETAEPGMPDGEPTEERPPGAPRPDLRHGT